MPRGVAVSVEPQRPEGQGGVSGDDVASKRARGAGSSYPREEENGRARGGEEISSRGDVGAAGGEGRCRVGDGSTAELVRDIPSGAVQSASDPSFGVVQPAPGLGDVAAQFVSGLPFGATKPAVEAGSADHVPGAVMPAHQPPASAAGHVSSRETHDGDNDNDDHNGGGARGGVVDRGGVVEEPAVLVDGQGGLGTEDAAGVGGAEQGVARRRRGGVRKHRTQGNVGGVEFVGERSDGSEERYEEGGEERVADGTMGDVCVQDGLWASGLKGCEDIVGRSGTTGRWVEDDPEGGGIPLVHDMASEGVWEGGGKLLGPGVASLREAGQRAPVEEDGDLKQGAFRIKEEPKQEASGYEEGEYTRGEEPIYERGQRPNLSECSGVSQPKQQNAGPHGVLDEMRPSHVQATPGTVAASMAGVGNMAGPDQYDDDEADELNALLGLLVCDD
eukprot:jgi/Mesvir1/19123/Mv12865-RA.1